jgi:hypothetical protein
MTDRKRQTDALTGAAIASKVARDRHAHGPREGGGTMFSAVPLLVLPVVLYNIFALTQVFGNQITGASRALTGELMTIPMPMNGSWAISAGDLFVLLGLFMLFFELIRATNTNKIAIVNHSLSMILFILCLVEFLLVPGFSTSTFFLITVMTLLDVLAGFIVTIVTARKDFEFGG